MTKCSFNKFQESIQKMTNLELRLFLCYVEGVMSEASPNGQKLMYQYLERCSKGEL